MKKILLKLALLGATLFAYNAANAQTVAVTADLKTMFNAGAATKTQLCLSLTDGNGNQLSNPRTSSGVIVPTATQCVSPDGSGHISTTVIANDQITPSNSIYSVTYTFNGRVVHGDIFQFALADGTENLNTKTSLSIIPIVPTPTGDTTYARLDGGNSPFTGNETFNGNVSVGGTLTTASENGIQIVGNGTNTNIAAAIANAGSTGTVMIPRSYLGTDAFTPPGLNIIDLRTANGAFENRVQSIVAPAFPVANFPLGSDLVNRSRGPADNYIEHLIAATTTTVTLNPGANTNFLIGAVTVGNGTRGTVQTGTTSLLSTSAGIIIGRGTSVEEIVNSGSWSIVDGTHITAACANTHSGTTDIEQLGTTILTSYQLMINSRNVSPSQNANQPLRVIDGNGNGNIVLIPTSLGGSWPNAGVQWSAALTGLNGPNKDFIFRHNNSASLWKFNNAANTATLFLFDNNGNLSLPLAGSRLAVGQASATMSGDFRGAAIGSGFDGINITDGTARFQLGYSSTSLAGTKLVPAQIQWGNAGTAGDLEMGARGNQPTHVCIYTSPDAGTTGLVKNLCVNPDGSLLMKNPLAAGTAAALTGTGACATITTQTGGSWAGRATCTGTTGASTLTITPGTTATNGWVCHAQDQTTRANLFQQTSTVAASCTLTATSITQNDVFVFSAIAF